MIRQHKQAAAGQVQLAARAEISVALEARGRAAGEGGVADVLDRRDLVGAAGYQRPQPAAGQRLRFVQRPFLDDVVAALGHVGGRIAARGLELPVGAGGDDRDDGLVVSRGLPLQKAVATGMDRSLVPGTVTDQGAPGVGLGRADRRGNAAAASGMRRASGAGIRRRGFNNTIAVAVARGIIGRIKGDELAGDLQL